MQEVGSHDVRRHFTKLMQLAIFSMSTLFDDFWKSEKLLNIADLYPRNGYEAKWSAAIIGVSTKVGAQLRCLKLSVELELSPTTLSQIVANCPNLTAIGDLCARRTAAPPIRPTDKA